MKNDAPEASGPDRGDPAEKKPASGGRFRGWRGWIVLLIFNLIFLALLELVSAIVLRKVFKEKPAPRGELIEIEQPFDLRKGWIQSPNSVVGKKKTQIHTDARGLSIVPDPLTDPDYVIAVTGGSTMFGIGAPDNAGTVPSELQTILRTEYGIRANVVNLGVRGYKAVQEMIMLHDYMDLEHVDYAISISGYNDSLFRLINNDAEYSEIREDALDHMRLLQKVEEGRLLLVNAGLFLTRWSRTAQLFEVASEELKTWRKGGDRDAKAVSSEEWDELATKYNAWTKPHYAMMQADCASRGAGYCMYLQPTAATKSHLAPEEVKALEKKERKLGPNDLARMTVRPAVFYAKFASTPSTFDWVDMRSALDSTPEQTYVDHCHYNRAGAEALARAVAKDLAPRLRSHGHSG